VDRIRARALQRRCRARNRRIRDSRTTTTTSRNSSSSSSNNNSNSPALALRCTHLHPHHPCDARRRTSHLARHLRQSGRGRRLPHRNRPASRRPWLSSSQTRSALLRLRLLHHLHSHRCRAPPRSWTDLRRARVPFTLPGSSACLLDSRVLASGVLAMESEIWVHSWRIEAMLRELMFYG
jgi:hypothetical protein